MGNLFIVFTPLQLFVSQQIIRQEKLKNNVVIFGWDSQFHDAFEMMCLDELWHKKVFREDINKWGSFKLNNFTSIKKIKDDFKWLKKTCEEEHIETIYLGEILNQMCRFVAVAFSHLKYKIVFFEEGTSHYVNRPYNMEQTWQEKIKESLLDMLLFKPAFGCDFAKWHCTPNRPYDDLPMDKRYSMIPFHHQIFDVPLSVEPMFSSKLKKYVESNIRSGVEERRVMLMTDPLRELMKKDDLYLYFETIQETISSLDFDVVLYLKFHPREIQTSRDKILEIARQSGVKFKILSEKVNICVEYYLQMFKFEKVFFFNAATYFYNGYAFPKTEFVKLMPVLYKKAKAVGICNLTYMENMLKMIEPIAVES